MKTIIGLAVLSASLNLAQADPTFVATGSRIHAPGAKAHRASRAQMHPTQIVDLPAPVIIGSTEPVTVTGTRPHSFDFKGSEAFVAFSSVAARDLSDPPSVSIVAEPVQLTVATGNTPELRQRRVDFPFESAQDRMVRESDVLKVRLARFKFD